MTEGFRNTYRKGIPGSEAVLKDLVHCYKSLKHYVLNGFKHRDIFVYPDFPSKKTSLFKSSDVLKMNLSNKYRRSPDLIFYWEDVTFGEPEKLEAFAPVEKEKILNFKCNDISKEYVDDVFKRVFSYSTIIDPTSHKGKAVKKSDVNAKHDGRIIECPIEKTEPGMVYQILIDNKTENGDFLDYRIPVVGKALDFVYLKFKKQDVRFDNITSGVQMTDAAAVFTADEIKLINRFCKEIKLDFGELDILRDKTDERIYIIDVNKTPYSPPSQLATDDSLLAIRKIAKALKERYLYD